MERIPSARRLAPWAAAFALLTAGLLVAAWPAARADVPADALPDLIADPPSSPTLDNSVNSTTGAHNLLLRFNGYIHNTGTGALELRGSRATTSDPMVPLQRVYQAGSTTSYRDDPMPAGTQLQYSDADGHHHWHFQRIALYSLWTDDRSEQVAPAMKAGFCIADSQHMTSASPTTAVYPDTRNSPVCAPSSPDALSLYEGVSPGWRDIYPRSLAFQWVDVSDVQPGNYWLREEVDPESIIHESNETNPPAWPASKFTIPGYIAKAITAPPLPYGQSQDVTLDAAVYGSPGTRAFRIVTPPAHGTLSVTTGSAFTDPTVRYTPATGYSGPDQFSYEALDSTSSYPVHPGTATVALSVAAAPAPRVVIQNAPTAMRTGTGVQLHATVTNDLPGVTWSVDGTGGGSARSGTITPGGFYTAPADVPPGGQVTISARSASGASDGRTIRIVWSPPPGPAPGTHGSKKSKGILGSIATGIEGSVLAASVTPTRAGVVWITADIIGGHRVASCSERTPTGRRFTCRTRLARGVDLRKLKIVARLLRHHHVVARVARVGAP